MKGYTWKYLRRIGRMEDIRIPKTIHWPVRRRKRIGRPLKRLLYRYNRKAGKGYLLVNLHNQKKNNQQEETFKEVTFLNNKDTEQHTAGSCLKKNCDL